MCIRDRDPTLHWIPFTYTGAIRAYVLNAESAGLSNASDEASQAAESGSAYGYTYDHCLFIADNPVTNSVSWDSLNKKNMIFGADYSNGGVDYTIRVPSVGSKYQYSDTCLLYTSLSPVSWPSIHRPAWFYIICGDGGMSADYSFARCIKTA